jgi:hypothetical protein
VERANILQRLKGTAVQVAGVPLLPVDPPAILQRLPPGIFG